MVQAKPNFDGINSTISRAREPIFSKDFCDASSEDFRRELNVVKFKKDPNDIFGGKGQFLTKNDYTANLADKNPKDGVTIEILSPDNYDNGLDSNIVKVKSEPLDSFALKDLVADPALKQHYSGNTIQVNKKKDGFSTFDDGLLFKFPIGEY